MTEVLRLQSLSILARYAKVGEALRKYIMQLSPSRLI